MFLLPATISGWLMLFCGQVGGDDPVLAVRKMLETVEQELAVATQPSARGQREGRAKVRAAQRELLAVATLQRDAQQARASFNMPRGLTREQVCQWVLPNWARMTGYYVGGFKFERAKVVEQQFDLGVCLASSDQLPGRIQITSDPVAGFLAAGALQRGDEITAIDGQPLPPQAPDATLLMHLHNAKPGQTLELSVLQAGLPADVTLPLNEHQRCTVVVPAISPRGGRAVRLRVGLAHEGGRWQVCGMEFVPVPRVEVDRQNLPVAPKTKIMTKKRPANP